MEEKVNEAVNYASGSNSLEDNRLTPDELQQLIEDIRSGKNDESFLYSVVRMIREKEGRIDEMQDIEVETHRKIR